MVGEAVILAAGEGSRLRPFTEDIPKVMLPVANKPILEYVINAIRDSGIRKIIMIVGYKKESVMDYFGSGSRCGVEIEYITQEKQLGTGHALFQARELVKGEEFIVLPGDNIIDKDVILKLMNSPTPALVVEESDIPSKYGVVEIDGDIIKNLIEKPPVARTNIVSTGIYKFDKRVFELLDELLKEGRTSLIDAILQFVQEGILYGVKGNGKWRDAVYPWDLLKMNEEILNKVPATISGKIEENVIIKGKVSIGENTIIHSGSYLVGPITIGEGCEIGPHACIFPSTSIGNNVTIYPFSEIRDSLIMDSSTIGSFSYISKSVIGRGTKISDHFSTLVGDSIIEIEGEIKKVKGAGAFIGGECNIESGVVIKGGAIIGKRAHISSNKVLSGRIENDGKVV